MPADPEIRDVFQPAQLGPLRLRNRIIKAATFEGMAPEALVTDELIDYHRRPAAGGVAMSTVAYCAVAPEGRTQRGQLWMRPEVLPGLRRLTAAVHETGAAVALQLGHAGPVADARSNRAPALAPMAGFNPVSLRRDRAATPADLDRIVRAHADAARLAAECGFDAVELHLGHNYLASAFLSPRLNRRTDRYGGSLRNRARLALEIARAVREELGDRIAITAKLNMSDGARGGLAVADSLQVARWLQDAGSVDALTLTAGSSLLNPMYLFRGEAPVKEFAAQFPLPQRVGIRLLGRKFLRSYPYEPLYLLERAREFRRALTLPVVLIGGVTDRAGMDRAMSEGFDFVAMARALLREPDLVERIRGDATTQSRCIHCNRCMPTIYTGTHCPLIGTDR
ncbi:NADH:flavin oxidoreductase [Streptomyces sp. A7024]|uniref:NADH:flavin oxidoreductase n=1 Tax=Streptomyces coryli TaxID=1128680 RepID=A0A6G4U0L5_9ACTN|nr:NADH:flavin oxidoreductase [Streptomyces coryli]NGN65623.1 NADH:flavin oxidoreductase [Streptomyces coryli]